jgi:tRNA threonylcarbamoyladenosine biosynthesis protein TsaB
MMVLGIETSTAMGSAALVDEQGIRGKRCWETKGGHAERLMEEIDCLLQKHSITIQALDGFAVTIGPGSFTGLRVGLATVKGLAMVGLHPVIPVSTLEALARNISGPSHPVCPLLDARREEVFAALFRQDENGQWLRLWPDRVMTPAGLLEGLSGPTTFVGEGAVRYQGLIEQRLGKKAKFASAEHQWPSATVVAKIGLSRLLRGETAQAKEIRPLYLRRPDAEINLEKGKLAAGAKYKVKIERG